MKRNIEKFENKDVSTDKISEILKDIDIENKFPKCKSRGRKGARNINREKGKQRKKSPDIRHV